MSCAGAGGWAAPPLAHQQMDPRRAAVLALCVWAALLIQPLAAQDSSRAGDGTPGFVGAAGTGEVGSFYGVADTFYGQDLDGLNVPLAASRLAAAAAVAETAAAADSDDADGGGDSSSGQSDCSQTADGCQAPYEWTAVQEGPQVRHPVGSAAGAAESRNLWSGAIHDPR